MYKLYGYIPELKLLKVSFDLGTIIDVIANEIYKVDYIHFMIVLQTEDRMTPYKVILSEKDYFDLIAEYTDKEEQGIVRKKVLK